MSLPPPPHRPSPVSPQAPSTWDINPFIRALRVEHWLFACAAAGAAFLVLSTATFSLARSGLVVGCALISVLPVGALLLRLALPEVRGPGQRLALAGIIGYSASIFVGYFLGVFGLPGAYLPFVIACAGVWGALWLNDWRLAAARLGWAEQLRQVWQPLRGTAPWVAASLGLLGVMVVTPLLAPVQPVTRDLAYSYADIDSFYQLAQTQVLRQGAPRSINTEVAGLRPTPYPDFHNLWLAQLTAWSGADLEDVYFVIAPVLMVLFHTWLLYACGRQLTGHTWGGYLAAALAYVVLIPNPYDLNLLQRSVEVGANFGAVRIHFQGLHSNPAFDVSWQLLAGITFLLALFHRYPTVRTRAGLLTLAALVAVPLLKTRPQYFMGVAPPLVLVCLRLAGQHRRWQYVVPVAVMGALAGAIYGESLQPYYEPVSTRLAAAYGLFGAFLIDAEPASSLIPPLARLFPALLQPTVAVLVLVVVYLMGLIGSGLIAYRLWQVARRRATLGMAEGYLLAVVLCAVAAGSTLVLEARRELGGAWGVQALYVIPGAVRLLMIVPLLQVLRRVVTHLGLTADLAQRLALGSLVLAGLFTYRAASAQHYSEMSRAYPLTRAAQDAYYWLRTQTPAAAVVAAAPWHSVNARGETVLTTNFLSGMTQRPAYLQRIEQYHLEEAQVREQFLERLFTATSPTEVQALLQTPGFDYLLVYADTPPATDLACCLTLVFEGEPHIYATGRDQP